MIKKTILAVAIFTSLAGCATTSSNSSSYDVKFDPKAQQELVSASIEARDELRLLAKTRDSQAQVSMTESQRKQRFLQATNVPQGFDKIGTVQYTGEAVGAAKLLAKLAGYDKVTEIGNKPRSALIVSLDQRNTKIDSALRELGMQTGDKATIEVFPSSSTIRVKYNDTDQESKNVYSK